MKKFFLDKIQLVCFVIRERSQKSYRISPVQNDVYHVLSDLIIEFCPLLGKAKIRTIVSLFVVSRGKSFEHQEDSPRSCKGSTLPSQPASKFRCVGPEHRDAYTQLVLVRYDQGKTNEAEEANDKLMSIIMSQPQQQH